MFMNQKHKKVSRHHLSSINSPSLSSSLTMAKGKRGYKVTTTNVAAFATAPILSLLPCHDPRLLLQPCCNNCWCHGCCLYRYQCHLPEFVDCCLPPKFLLLSATTLATVAATATTEPVFAPIAIAVRHRHRNH